MKAILYGGVGEVVIGHRADPSIVDPTDAIVRIVVSGICGTDLWFYRGEAPSAVGAPMGHEFVGVVEAVGAEVERIRCGDLVVAPFTYADGVCDHCKRQVFTSCRRGGGWAGADQEDGAQGEAVRAPFADFNLVKLPSEWRNDQDMLAAALTLADVLPTGEHAATLGDVGPADKVIVLGDGPIAVSAVLACLRRNVEQVVVLGHHDMRLALAKDLGATVVGNIHTSNSLAALENWADVTIDCAGRTTSLSNALAMARPGGRVAFVGIPLGVDQRPDPAEIYRKNLRLAGGVTPALKYMPELLSGLSKNSQIQRLFTHRLPFDEAVDGYRAMNDRSAVKVMLRL